MRLNNTSILTIGIGDDQCPLLIILILSVETLGPMGRISSE